MSWEYTSPRNARLPAEEVVAVAGEVEADKPATLGNSASLESKAHARTRSRVPRRLFPGSAMAGMTMYAACQAVLGLVLGLVLGRALGRALDQALITSVKGAGTNAASNQAHVPSAAAEISAAGMVTTMARTDAGLTKGETGYRVTYA